MSNLYPNNNSNPNNNPPNNNATRTTTIPAPGSFDDYDSIIDGYSIGYAESDVSSMHMSEMGGVSVVAMMNAASNSPARNNANNAMGVGNAGAAVDGGGEADGAATEGAVGNATGRETIANDNVINHDGTMDEVEAPGNGAQFLPASIAAAMAAPVGSSIAAVNPFDDSAAQAAADRAVNPFDGVAATPFGNTTTTNTNPPSTDISGLPAAADDNTEMTPPISMPGSTASSTNEELYNHIGVIGAPTTNNGNHSPQLSTTSNHSNNSGYYNIGDLGLPDAFDATDVSAILGVASEDVIEQGGELLVASSAAMNEAASVVSTTGGNNYNNADEEGDDNASYHSLPGVESLKHDLALSKSMERKDSSHAAGLYHRSNNSGDEEDDLENQNQKQIGPLGDELSYSQNSQAGQQHGTAGALHNSSYDNKQAFNQYYPGYQESEYDSDDSEDEEKIGIVPNWIAHSSQRTKCVLVSSTALILGSLVLAVVAVGIAYGTGAFNISEGSGGGGGGGASLDRAEILPGDAIGEAIVTGTTAPSVFSTTLPTFSPTEDVTETSSAPVLSTTGEAASSNSPTQSNTSTSNNAPFATASPTLSPRIEPAQQLVSTNPTSGPTLSPNTSPTASPSISMRPSTPPTVEPTSSPSHKPSSSPTKSFTNSPSLPPSYTSSTIPTLSYAPTSSAIPTLSPSVPPTTTYTPSHPPTNVPTPLPSLLPSTSSAPSLSFGAQATEEGDAIFYLMADGGSNWQYWTERLEGLVVEDHKFLVHLGSVTRIVDSCTETAYYRTQLSLSVSPVPVYSVPGNNDYPSCPNPQDGWDRYAKHMMNIDTIYWNETSEYSVKRERIMSGSSDSGSGGIGNMENFSFLYKRVLFVGLNMVTNDDVLPGGENVTNARLESNIRYIKQNVDAYDSNVDAVFIMGYGRLLATENIPFYEAMVAQAKSTEWKDKLVIYARRSATTDIDYNVGGAKNFIELRVGNEWPIMDVRVRTEGKGKEAKVEWRDASTVEEIEEEEVEEEDV